MDIGPSFQFHLAKLPVGIRLRPNDPQALPPQKRAPLEFTGRSHRWLTSRATRVGAESQKARARIHILAPRWRAPACSGFRDRTTALTTGSLPAPSTGSLTAPLKADATTTVQTFPSAACAKFIFLRSRLRGTPASARS